MRKNKNMSNKKVAVSKAKMKPAVSHAKDTKDKEGAFFRAIVENFQGKITVLDKNKVIRYQNAGFNVNDFYLPEDIIGKTFIEFVHPGSTGAVLKMFNDLIRNPGTVRQMRVPFRYKDGLWHYVDIRAKSMLDIPAVAGIVVASRDVTDRKAMEDELKTRSEQLEHEIEDRKKAEQALSRSEEFFRTIVQNSFDSIVVIDSDGTRKYASSSFSNVGGYDSEDMLGKNVFDLVHPDDKAMAMRIFRKLIEDPFHVHSLQTRYLAKNGEYIWVEVLGMNMLNNPTVQGIVLDTRDITSSRKIEEELHKSEERFRAIVQNSTDVIVILDEKGMNKYISPSLQRITGYTMEDRMGKSSLEFIHPDDLDKVMKSFTRVINKPNHVYKGENRYLHKDGTYRWFEITAVNLLKDPNVNGIVLTFRDVSERKLSEQRLKEEMEITSHLLSLSEAVATITDVNKLMAEVVRASKKIMGSEITVSYLWDKQTGVFVPSEQTDLPNGILPLFRTENIDMKHISKFLDIKKPFLVKFAHSVLGDDISMPIIDIDKESIIWLYLSHHVDIRDVNAMIVIPLMNRGEWLGMIVGSYLKKERTSRFTERYYKAIKGLANQVSIALEQAKLYRESVEKTMDLAHRIEVINTMYEIDRSILSNLTSGDILNTVTRMAGKLLPCDVAAIMIFDKESQGFTRVASAGILAKELGSFFLSNSTSVTDVLRTGRPQYIPNLGEIKDILPFEAGLLQKGLISVMRVPLTAGNEIIGTLGFGAKRASAFTPEDLLTAERLGSQISVALANARLITDLEESSIATIKSLSNAIDAKSQWTSGHSEGVARYAQAIGKTMGFDEKRLNDLEVAALLHDIGKIGTYAYILDKREKLTEEEWSLIRQHPDKGVEIIAPIKQLKHIVSAIKHHHEFFDGSGYPSGLKGEEIPIMARILAVADAVDAMSFDRPYRKGMRRDEIIQELNRCAGNQFDPEIVKVLLSIKGVFDV